MPPKKKAPEPSKKTEQKKKEKVVEDKTFGLKNKKGAKTQKFIQQVAKSHGGPKKAEEPRVTKKEEKKKELLELNQIFKPVATQKVEKGVDPKSVLCAFFKQGQCTKGDKCKFSHDLTLDRKGEKRSAYCDVRHEDDDMENWDEEKLKEVVEKKHGENERKLPKTDIICKYFLEALENSKYGWFWECPSGGDKCHYKHALPPGFVLNKDKKKQDKKDEISIEELVEKERSKLGSNLTRITFQTFLDWKKKKLSEKNEKSRKEEERKKQEYRAGRHVGLSGRDMFTFNPELMAEDDMEEDESAVEVVREEEDSAVCYKEIDLNALASEAQEVAEGAPISTREQSDSKLNGAVGGQDESVPIDENLFAEEDEDLEELEEEISALTVE